MIGVFYVATPYTRAVPTVTVSLQIWPPVSDVPAAGQIYQSWIQFSGWDSTVNSTSNYNSVVISNNVTNNTNNVTYTNPYRLNNTCGKNQLSSILSGGYKAVASENPKCANPWGAPACLFGPDTVTGLPVNACIFTRPFNFTGAVTLTRNQPISFIVGFNKWSNSTLNAINLGNGSS